MNREPNIVLFAHLPININSTALYVPGVDLANYSSNKLRVGDFFFLPANSTALITINSPLFTLSGTPT